MAAKYILSVLAVFFLALGSMRVVRSGIRNPAAKTWLLVGFMFFIVSLWLWTNR